MTNLSNVREDERETEREERVIEETMRIFDFSRDEAVEFLHVPMDRPTIDELLVFFGCTQPMEQ
jgi:hypothetical protein